MTVSTGKRKGHKRHKDGQLIRTSPESAKNGKPKKMFITHGGASALQRHAIDLRTTLGRKYRAGLAELKAHLGNDITVPQARLVDSAVRLGLLADLSWGEVMGAERLVKDGAPHPAIDVFLKASKQHAATLQMLGLEQRVRNVTLSDVLEGRVEHES